MLDAAAVPVLEATVSRCRRACPEFEPAAIEAALKSALVDGLGLKPRVAFAAVRVAVTGSTVSPPLYESMALLGRDVSPRPARLRARSRARCVNMIPATVLPGTPASPVRAAASHAVEA